MDPLKVVKAMHVDDVDVTEFGGVIKDCTGCSPREWITLFPGLVEMPIMLLIDLLNFLSCDSFTVWDVIPDFLVSDCSCRYC